MDFPCHDKADIGQAGFQTYYYIQQREKATLRQFPYSTKILKLKQMECMPLLRYYPPHCYLGNNSARRKLFLIPTQVQTLQRIEEIETILYFPSQRLKNQ